MKNLRNEKGITLVALIVTVIVLLILAAVTLSLVGGSEGIVEKSANAVDKTQIASAKEQVELKVAEWVSDYYEAKYVGNNGTYLAEGTTAQDYISSLFTAATDGEITVGNYTLTQSGNTITVNGTGLLQDALTVNVATNGALTDWSM